MTEASIEVIDATGRMVWNETTGRSSGIVELPRRVLLPGLYHIALLSEGVRIESIKFTTIR